MAPTQIIYLIISTISISFLAGMWSGLRRGKWIRDDAWIRCAITDKTMEIDGSFYHVLPVIREALENYQVGTREINNGDN